MSSQARPYALKPCADDVQQLARCVSEPPTSFCNAWFVIIRHHKVSEGTKRTCEKFPPDSSVFLADIVRTLQRGTFAQCRACSSVQAISSELILLIVFFPWVSAIPQNSFPISPLHTFAKATSIGRLAPSAPDFSPPVLLSYNFSSSSCLTRLKKAFSTLATVCGVLPSASYALKPCADEVQQLARCVSKTPMHFLEWLVRGDPKSKSVRKYTTDMRRISTRVIRVPRRHRANTSRWYSHPNFQ